MIPAWEFRRMAFIYAIRAGNYSYASDILRMPKTIFRRGIPPEVFRNIHKPPPKPAAKKH